MLYFIVNEKSRTGRAAFIWKEIQEILRKRKVEFREFTTEYRGHAQAIARQVCNEPGEDICIVVLGGDGTLNEVINGITDFARVRLGVLPTGSGNDFARGLGLKGTAKENLGRILRCVDNGRFQAVDLGLVKYGAHYGNAKRFAISSGIGMDALVCKRATLHSKLKNFLNKLGLGKLTYIILTVQALFHMDTARAAFQLEGEEIRRLKKIIFIAAMNFRAEGGGVPMAPRADAQDGKLSVCAVHGIPKWKTFLYLPLLAAAKHEHIRGYEVTDSRSCRVKLDKPMALHADGEYCGEVTDVAFACLPGLLRVMK